MCVLAMWVPDRPDGTLVIGANRDEAYARASAPPSEIEPGIIAGRDLEKGGTWLGLNRDGLFVAVTNRFTPMPSTDAYSRGLLTLEALRFDSVEDVADLVRRRLDEHTMAGFNLVALAGGGGVSLHFDGTLRTTDFGAGTHVVSSNLDINDPDMPEKHEFDRFVSVHPGPPDADGLRSFLSSHEGSRPVCKHGDHFGTVSSTMLISGPDGQHLFHAQGPPCRAPYVEVPIQARLA